MPRNKVTFSGRLYTHRHTFQVSAKVLDQQAIDAVNTVANMYKDSILEVISLGGPGWNLNTPYYRHKKAKMGYGDTPYVKTGKLLEFLGVESTANAIKRHRASAGFREGNHPSGYMVSELVAKLDEDRPLINPAWERISHQANNILSSVGVGILR